MNNIELRKATSGDEKILAYIQTESWKAAFAGILSEEDLVRCTDVEKVEAMYRNVLCNHYADMTIEYVDGEPHCIAAWSRNRDGLGEKIAELICIHSLQDKWHQGYGSVMMHHILDEMRQAGFSEVVLWVFKENVRARCFYEKHDYVLTDMKKQGYGTVELMYSKRL